MDTRIGNIEKTHSSMKEVVDYVDIKLVDHDNSMKDLSLVTKRLSTGIIIVICVFIYYKFYTFLLFSFS